MRVLLLTSDFLPNAGGIAAHVAGLASALARSGCKVLVVVPGSTRSGFAMGQSWSTMGEVSVVRVNLPAIPFFERLLWEPCHRFLFKRIAMQFSPDVLHWHTPLTESQIVKAWPNALRVFTNHTSQFLDWVLGGENPAQALMTVEAADVVICPSDELVEATRKIGFPGERTVFLSNGVDPDLFAPTVDGNTVRQSLGFEEQDVIVLCPRRLEKKNGVTFWLEAIPRVIKTVSDSARVRFVLIGDYDGDPRYSDRVNVVRKLGELSLGDTFRWTGNVPPEFMPSYFAASDIVVLPSLQEATSIAALEAMASGKPVIGTRVGGLAQLISHQSTGMLVPPGDSLELAHAMISLIRDKAVRAEMGRAARERVLEQFSWERIAESTRQIYTRFLAQKDSSPVREAE